MSVVLLDCDGVLADFVGHMIARLNAHGHAIPEVKKYDFLRAFDEPVGVLARRLLEDPAHWAHIPPYDVRAQVDALRSDGHDVVCVTSPWLSCASWCSVRRDWLKRHFGFHHNDVIVTARKHLVRGDAFIDDRWDAVAAWGNANPMGLALLMDRSWTKDDPSVTQRFDWSIPDMKALRAWLRGVAA